MASKKLADHTLYHVAPQGFWKRFRDATVVSPYISSGLPIASVNRYPQPASRPEKYSTPATKASDPAENPYWKRDVRRAFPKLSVVTQTELSSFLLQTPEAPAQVTLSEFVPTCAYPIHSQIGEPKANASVPAAAAKDVSLTEAISSKGQVYSASKLPPRLPTSYSRWIPADTENAPHHPDAYWPMSLVK